MSAPSRDACEVDTAPCGVGEAEYVDVVPKAPRHIGHTQNWIRARTLCGRPLHGPWLPPSNGLLCCLTLPMNRPMLMTHRGLAANPGRAGYSRTSRQNLNESRVPANAPRVRLF